MTFRAHSAVFTGEMKAAVVERPHDALDGIPVVLRLLPAAAVVGWLAAAVYAVAYVVGR